MSSPPRYITTKACNNGEQPPPPPKNKWRTALVSRFPLPALATLYIMYVNVYTNYLFDASQLKNCAIVAKSVLPPAIRPTTDRNRANLAPNNGTATTAITATATTDGGALDGWVAKMRVGGGSPPPPPPPPPPRVLVVYAGPSTPPSHPMTGLYIKNFEFFLRYGVVDCDVQDTVIVVGREYYAPYLPWVRRLNRMCGRRLGRSGGGVGGGGGGGVILVSRRSVCYDMEAAHLTLSGGVPGLRELSTYDYFVFANCGVTGPAPPSARRTGPWTSHFTALLDERVKMTGLSMNCKLVDGVHVQSMMYAVDRVGLEIIAKSGAIFDCLEEPHKNQLDYIVEMYEKKMGKAILDAGYALRPLIGGSDLIVTKSNVRDCVPCEFYNLKENHVEGGVVVNVTGLTPGCDVRNQFKDIWMESRYETYNIHILCALTFFLHENLSSLARIVDSSSKTVRTSSSVPRLMALFDGKVPSLDDVIFFKTSRLLTPDIAAQINYTGKIHWKWH